MTISEKQEAVKLEPCPTPWCPASAPALMQGGFRGQSYIVRCETCHLSTPRFYEADKAVGTWNTRTPKQTEPLADEVERVADALRNADLNDGDEGNHYRLFDLLDFSGENKAVMVTRQLASAAIKALGDSSNG